MDFLCALKELKPQLSCTTNVCCNEMLKLDSLYPKMQPKLVRILMFTRFNVHISLRKDKVNHSGYALQRSYRRQLEMPGDQLRANW